MNTYRLRVERPVEPSTPHSVVDVISTLGGNIVSFDLREVDGPRAIDELVVELPREMHGATLSAVLDDDPTATLLSSQSCERDEPVQQARRWVRTQEADLPRRLAVACPLSTAWIRTAEDAAALPPVRMALERGGPVAHRSAGLPESLVADGARVPVWLLAVPDRYPEPRSVALLARPVSLRFTAAEVARVELLMAS